MDDDARQTERDAEFSRKQRISSEAAAARQAANNTPVFTPDGQEVDPEQEARLAAWRAANADAVSSPVNPSYVTLMIMVGVLIVLGFVLVGIGAAQDTTDTFDASAVAPTSGLPLMFAGGFSFSLAVMAIFSVLIVAAVRWKPKS